MIEANELRIGNKVYADGKEVEVGSVLLCGINSSNDVELN